MHVTRQKLLARTGALNHIEEPSGDSGGGADTEETPDKEASGSGDRGDGDNEGSDDSDEDGDDDFKPITSKEEFERILGKRLHRERAKFADYSDLKQKVADQEATIADLQEKLGESTLKEQRKSIADKAGVPESVLRGSTEAELQAHADELKAAFIKNEEDDRAAARRAARSPYTGTGDERPREANTETGRERARARAKRKES